MTREDVTGTTRAELLDSFLMASETGVRRSVKNIEVETRRTRTGWKPE